ncbi:MAG: glucose-6-phosphate isomerase [Eggerthellaceae bacterium]|nr:glucose-6-phosphate isomerase [Eggerthellaceae bacterium]
MSFKDLEQRHFYSNSTNLELDWQAIGMDKDFIFDNSDKLQAALDAMDQLEAGAIANPSEGRMVGHYWLRNSDLAPTPEIKKEIDDAKAKVKTFAADVLSGKIVSERGGKFENLLVAGIGGSSLGSKFVYEALKCFANGLKLFFMDNTDPDGMDATFEKVRAKADQTLLVVISKSGRTIETRNCQEEARKFYKEAGLDFSKHAVCVTAEGSKLYNTAQDENWIEFFPMCDFVGGRTSVMSPVGLLPLSLVGIDVDGLLHGAADCDELSRTKEFLCNPGAIMAMNWYYCSGGVGGTTQIVLPYKDNLFLLANYLQQLVMESLGKEYDLDGNKVNQGLAVLGNKGSTDQHSYVQQLVSGPDNVFVTFVSVLKDRLSESSTVGEDSTSGDYLNAFMLGTRAALASHGKKSMSITVREASAYNIGQIIALFERAVGIYAQLININAYDQPAVEFGKKAASSFIDLKNEAKDLMLHNRDVEFTVEELAADIDKPDMSCDLFRIMEHVCANEEHFEMIKAYNYLQSTFCYR